ncbi:MAG TPA: hypothetical protein VH877_31775 [Polyangia bacterium]|jgi:hypothetical protein|nr:hypothetical protein [Polyangia bacterium]
MTPMARKQRRGRSLVLVLLVTGALFCASRAEGLPPFGSPPFYFVAGEITPDHFDFREMIPHTGPEDEPGGWREACVYARMRNIKTQQSAICDFQPGVPIVTAKKNRITVRDAKNIAARAANRAARTILGGGTPPGIACVPFRELMAKLMQDDGIPGAKVRRCDGKVPPIYFDPER